MPKQYPAEFRQRVIALLEAGRKVADIAADLDVSANTIYILRRQHLIDTGQIPGTSSIESSEFAKAQREIAKLRAENEILRRANESMKNATPPRRRFEMIEQITSESHDVKASCELLDVSRAGLYAWKGRPLSAMAIRQAWLTEVITEVHTASRGIHGAPPVHAELRLGRGIVVGHNQVGRLMRNAGLVGLPLKRRFKRTSRADTSDGLVNRVFARTEPDQLWAADITEQRTSEGKF